jgi:hypothetical protein
MSANSTIEGTDHMWNPWIGCTKVSKACDKCFAEKSIPSRTMGITVARQDEADRDIQKLVLIPTRVLLLSMNLHDPHHHQHTPEDHRMSTQIQPNMSADHSLAGAASSDQRLLALERRLNELLLAVAPFVELFNQAANWEDKPMLTNGTTEAVIANKDLRRLAYAAQDAAATQAAQPGQAAPALHDPHGCNACARTYKPGTPNADLVRPQLVRIAGAFGQPTTE